ncbi:MAG: hypothetical protein EOP86_22340 [Verrucomicrobiaceae bacterium]|nr:MAG: hypothetical protein EOP86_22340 [Verrucomicrobiaceae bacterium]
MARRRRSGLQPAHLIAAVSLLVFGGGAAWWLNHRGRNDLGSGHPPFPAGEFQQNFFGLRGNRYLVQGTITEQLRYAQDRTRLFALSITDTGMAQPCDVGLLVPSEFADLNMQTGQSFRMLIEVNQDGLLKAVDIRKA